MQIVKGLESYRPDGPPAAVALGVFDGIHLAHRKILTTAVARARDSGLLALACTFDPNPVQVLQPERAPTPITFLEERLTLIAETGIEATVVLAFTPALASVEPESFVKDVLVGKLRAREVVVGYNHTFGRGARGNARMLVALAGQLGFQANVVAPLLVDGVPVSSTEIRNVLRVGEVDRAQRYLGRPYSVQGEVVQGAGRGRSLGFPTANVRPDRPLLVPPGVYACWAQIPGTGHLAVVNIGIRPTFGENSLVVEAHLLDFSGVLYGRPVRLAFLARLRDERKFQGPEALREQITEDIAHARRRLSNGSFTPAGPGGSM